MGRIAQWNKPVGLMEWGCTETNVTIANKAAWIAAAWNFMKAWNADPDLPVEIESAVYFNNNLDVPSDGRATWELSGAALTAFQSACADSVPHDRMHAV